ncbi:hypothetical protein B0H11DRAFT_1938732 [Mycena galericulata]|nr:hypothetical protein B0H11DRAFT_1938732 [Mycena galericulata]
MEDFDEAVPSAVRDAVTRANFAMQCLHNIEDLSPQAFADIWPHYWPWEQFFYTFHDHLPWLEGRLSDSETAGNLLYFVTAVRVMAPRKTYEIMSRAPGFRAIVVRAWAAVVFRDHISPPEYRTISQIWDPRDASNFEDLTDGAGGELGPAAELVYHVSGVFTLVSEMETAANTVDQYTGIMVLAPLTAALMSRGIVPATTSLLTGLLKALIYVGEQNNLVSNNYLTFFFEQLLPSSMVHYHVVSKMEKALRDVRDAEHTARFKRSRQFEAWKEVKALVCKRLKVLEVFNAPDYISYRAWSATRFEENTSFANVPGARVHTTAQRNANGTHSSLSMKERDFLRALLNHDYVGMTRLNARMQELSFLSEHNAGFFTLFCCTRGLDIEVCALDDRQWAEVTGAARWVYDVARMEKSDGGMGTHVVVIAQGNVPRYLSFLSAQIPLEMLKSTLD